MEKGSVALCLIMYFIYSILSMVFVLRLMFDEQAKNKNDKDKGKNFKTSPKLTGPVKQDIKV